VRDYGWGRERSKNEVVNPVEREIKEVGNNL
jgi:hypothetical protein